MWMANSYSIVSANVTHVTSSYILLEVVTLEQGKENDPSVDSVEVSLDASPIDTKNYRDLPKIVQQDTATTIALPIDDFVRRVNRLCNIIKAYKATGKMIQMGVQLGGAGVGKLVRKRERMPCVNLCAFFCWSGFSL